MKQKTGRKLLGILLALAMVIGLLPGMSLTAYAETRTVTWSSNEAFPNGIFVGGVTDHDYELRMHSKGNQSFSTTLGKFTKIEVTGGWLQNNAFTGDGWNGRIWTGNAATVSYSGYLTDESHKNPWTISFIIEQPDTVAVTDVTLDKTSATLTVGGTETLTATVEPNDATDKKVKWSVSGTDTGAVKLYTDETCTTEVGPDATETLTVYAKGTSAGSSTVTATSNADSTKTASCAVTVNASTYSVTITAGNNMTKTEASGEASQTGLSGAMTDVVYTANNGYYFPEDYAVAAVNGISVTRNSYTQITVSGTPTADAAVTLTAPTAKTTPSAPTTAAATDCTTADNNDGKLTGLTTAMEYKKSDATSWTAGTGNDIIGLVPGTYYVRVKETDTTNVSDNQELTIKGFVSYTVTFKVVNGAWNDENTADKTVTVSGHEGDTLKLTTDQIPAVGSKPNDTYKAGSWDVTPSTDTAITAATTYTYTYAQKDSISQTVTFKVTNGKWDDETTADKTVTLTGYEGDTLKLAADQIPAVGTKPNDTYKAGSWDVTPSTDTAITEATTYTYTYVAKEVSVVTKAPEAKTLTYNGSAQELVTAGEATGGEMQYALGNATEATQPYTTSIPTATDAGTYYVWYKVVGDGNHNDSAPASVSATIRARYVPVVVTTDTDFELSAPEEGTVTAEGFNEIGEVNVTGKTGRFASGMQVQVDVTSGNEWKLTKDEASKVGYTLKPSAAEDAVLQWIFKAADINKAGGNPKAFGIEVEPYADLPSGTYTDTLTFTAQAVPVSSAIVSADAFVEADAFDATGELVEMGDFDAFIGTDTWDEPDAYADETVYDMGWDEEAAEDIFAAEDALMAEDDIFMAEDAFAVEDDFAAEDSLTAEDTLSFWEDAPAVEEEAGFEEDGFVSEGAIDLWDDAADLLVEEEPWVFAGEGIQTKTLTVTLVVTADTYTITYDLAGGTVEGENPASYTRESADITLINPVKEGFVFAGWTGTDLAEATATVVIPTGSKGDRSYIATWTEGTTETSTEVTTEASTEAVTTAPSTEVTTEASTERTTEAATSAPATEVSTMAPSTEAATEVTTEAATVAPATEVTTEPSSEETPVVQLGRAELSKTKNLKKAIQLTWKAVENAKEYEIFRKKEDGKLKKIGTTDKLVFEDEDVNHTVKYRYFVRAKGYFDDGVVYATGRLSKGRTQYFVKRSGKVAVSEKKGIISWTETKYVDGYQLLVAANKEMRGGKKFTVGNATQISTSGITVPAGTYYISLRQYIVRDGKKYVSAYHGAKKYVVK